MPSDLWQITPPIAPQYGAGGSAVFLGASALSNQSGVSPASTFTLRGDFSTAHTTMEAPTPAITSLAIGEEISPGSQAWTDLLAKSAFGALSLATSAKVTATLSGGTVGGWQKLELLATTISQSNHGSLSQYAAYLSDYREWLKLMKGDVDLSQGVAAGLRKLNDARAATKKAASSPKKAPTPADPTSKRSLAKAQKSAERTKARAVKKAAANAERNNAQRLNEAVMKEKKATSETLAKLTVAAQLQKKENEVANLVAARAKAIRAADPMLTPALKVEEGWKLVTHARTFRPKGKEVTRTTTKGGHPAVAVTTVTKKL